MAESKKNSVLIVDDEESNMMALSHILNLEYTVYAVKDGQDAIEFAEEFMPDVILLDIVMPEMDGYEVIAALKTSEKTHDIPVIFITGLGNTEDEEKGLGLGAADYIGKPFSPAIVKLRVQNQIQLINQMRLVIEKETAVKSSRARSEFLSRMSHEMRTPMNAIMGMATLAQKTGETEKRNDMLKKITGSSSHLLQIIDSVLDMADIEDNKLLLSCSEFSFTVMIQEILDNAETGFNAKQQSVTIGIDPSIPDTIIGDKRRLSQVISNLLSNAVKFTPEQGLIQINAFVCSVENEIVTLQIEVIDNGIGIPKEQQEKLFIPFEQADGGIDRKYGGSGLGLAISRYIVGLMGGAIWAESEPGKGSTFAFTMKAQIKPPEVKNDGPVSLEGKTALLVDDVEINREIVLAILEDTGLKIDCAENGREAVELFSAAPEKYDVILMDINMPEMDGVEATKRIRARGSQVPIIAMTANVLVSEVESYLAAGMNGHIGKPVDFDEVLDKLRTVLAL